MCVVALFASCGCTLSPSFFLSSPLPSLPPFLPLLLPPLIKLLPFVSAFIFPSPSLPSPPVYTAQQSYVHTQCDSLLRVHHSHVHTRSDRSMCLCMQLVTEGGGLGSIELAHVTSPLQCDPYCPVMGLYGVIRECYHTRCRDSLFRSPYTLV